MESYNFLPNWRHLGILFFVLLFSVFGFSSITKSTAGNCAQPKFISSNQNTLGSKISINWTGSSSTTSYRVVMTTDAGTSVSQNTSSTSLLLSVPKGATSGEVRISAICSNGDVSNPVAMRFVIIATQDDVNQAIEELCDILEALGYPGNNTIDYWVWDPLTRIVMPGATYYALRCSHIGGLKKQGTFDSFFKHYPNPADNYGQIEYSLDQNSEISLAIYNAQGQIVKEIFKESEQHSGAYNMIVRLDTLPPGLYFYGLTVNGFLHLKKVVKL